MKKKVYYQYNPETDNYERVYATMRDRLTGIFKTLIIGVIVGIGLFLIVFYGMSSPDEKALRTENAQLKNEYAILNSRVNNALAIMTDLQNRDDNFYRVIMQMDPVSPGQRLAGLANERRYQQLEKLSDAELVISLTQSVDLLDRQLYAQSQSFNELKETALKQKDKLQHIPSVLPINIQDYTMSSGYGYRIDPVYGGSKFHAGLDFAAPMGTPVFATADGTVTEAGWGNGYGNMIDIDHGNNYLTRFGHLSKIEVTAGQKVVRGELIGLVGSTGKSTGPHLHYEVRFKDEPQNPVNYYFMDITPEQYNEMIQQAENSGHVMD